MPKTKKSRFSKKFYIVLGLTFIVALGGFSLRAYLTSRAVPAEIDLIESLSYGPVELDGLIQKDAPVGKPGVYTLFINSGNYVILDVGNIDPFVGTYVHVTGDLSPAASETSKPILTIKTIKSK
jgi:hypothetical protein